MKHYLAVLFVVFAQAATVTTSATCRAELNGTTLFEVSDASFCSGQGNGYRTTAMLSAGRVSTRVSSDYITPITGARPSVSAYASITTEDSVLFPGSGLATLRVTMNLQAIASDYDGGLVYDVDGVSQSARLGLLPQNMQLTDRDYTIELGSLTAVKWTGSSISLAGPLGNFDTSSGFIFGIYQYRLYDMQGQQMGRIVGLGEGGKEYFTGFAPGDTSTGPVLTQTPEPSTIITACGSLSAALLIRILRRRYKPFRSIG